MIEITQVDHIGIRVSDADKALAFYAALGFEVIQVVEFDSVIIIKNKADVEINLVTNAPSDNDGQNILMDVAEKYPGLTHAAWQVASIKDTLATVKAEGLEISQGPVTFGDGHVSVFLRDPDRNVIELRSREQNMDDIEGLVFYSNEN
ncbi:MAG: VOC family protein [Alphaproteobacteria bacterium]|nr:VOC family protein [Alphaproteobacteria bacterium]MCZ6764137.1 VOC family protein [Alphaproteobacteria bacterium]